MGRRPGGIWRCLGIQAGGIPATRAVTRAPPNGPGGVSGAQALGPTSHTTLWLPFLCGLLWADTALSLARRAGRVEAAPDAKFPASAALVAPEPIDLEDADPRALRRLPGIGEQRAMDIARLRWERAGRGLRLSEVPGIGPKTERALEARGALSQPLLGE